MNTCKYCAQAEEKQYRPGLTCEKCVCFVHLECLRRPGTPGDLVGDIFFDFICEDCNESKKESIRRNKFPWVNVILLTLHHLSIHSHGISNNGYFHYKTHICSFIDRQWVILFGDKCKQKKNWIGTIAGTLSVYNHLLFKSGSIELKETGWWKLQHSFSPAVATHIITEMSKDKPKGRSRNQLALEQNLFMEKVTTLGYKDLLHIELDGKPESEPTPLKKRRMDSDDRSGASNIYHYDYIISDSRNDVIEEGHFEDTTQLAKESSYSDMDSIFRGFELTPSYVAPSDSSSLNSYQPALCYDSDSRSKSPYHQIEHQSDVEEKTDKQTDSILKKILEQGPSIKRKRESRFSNNLNSIDLPWLEKVPEPSKDVVEMSQYEEIQLFKQIENIIPKVKDPNKKAYLYRLKATLSLRRLKRHKHLPVFDLDKTVKLLGGYITEDNDTAANPEHILDRFQRSYLMDNLCGTIANTNYNVQLLTHVDAAPFRSTYSGTLLKPYIRRDPDAQPLWLKLTDELLRRTHKDVADYRPPAHATVDYSYVRPQHIAAVNNLCAQFFWPGIDLTEALQYPEFSCVVTYKKLVVGCAFLVPDVGHSVAYISFVLIRPEWRNAKIASFMLYHLLQTCTGKDVTLHVSPTNPAIFLYQKFGFKVEELVQDFYEKYYDIEYKGCRHALFLRLVR